MIQDKLKYEVPIDISEPEVSFIRNYIFELCEDGMLENCACNRIRVLIFNLTPLRSHFSARFECDCGKERFQINKKLIDV
jgi:hypothetical protein